MIELWHWRVYATNWRVDATLVAFRSPRGKNPEGRIPFPVGSPRFRRVPPPLPPKPPPYQIPEIQFFQIANAAEMLITSR